MVIVRKNQKFVLVVCISSNLVFYVMYVNTNKWIYNNVWLLNTILKNKLQFCLVLFTDRLLVFWTFCFQLTVQLLLFSLVRFLTNNSYRTFEASTRCWVEILRLGEGRYLVDSKNMPYFIDYSYFNTFDWLYFRYITDQTNSFSRL